jgi:hypothetical protein
MRDDCREPGGYGVWGWYPSLPGSRHLIARACTQHLAEAVDLVHEVPLRKAEVEPWRTVPLDSPGVPWA